MFLPTLLQAEGIRRVGAARGSLASTVGPPAALLLGMTALGERPTAWQLAGTLLIVAGIVVIARLGHRRSSRTDAPQSGQSAATRTCRAADAFR